MEKTVKKTKKNLTNNMKMLENFDWNTMLFTQVINAGRRGRPKDQRTAQKDSKLNTIYKREFLKSEDVPAKR